MHERWKKKSGMETNGMEAVIGAIRVLLAVMFLVGLLTGSANLITEKLHKEP